jgi:hypothetical protein
MRGIRREQGGRAGQRRGVNRSATGESDGSPHRNKSDAGEESDEAWHALAFKEIDLETQENLH